MAALFERLLDRYRDSDHIIKLKARFLLRVCIAAVVIIPFIIAYNMYLTFTKAVYGHAIYWPIIAPLVFIFFVYLSVIFLIAIGRFSIGAHLFFLATQLLMWSIIIVDKSGPLERLDTIVVLIAILSMSPLVITRRALLIPAYSAITVLAAVLFVKFVMPGLSPTETIDFLGDIAIAALAAAIFSYNLFSINRSALEHSEESRQDLARANEELAATNEELAATNEELEATMEELTATNEEFEAQNGELIKSQEAINESLREKNVLLREIHHRVKNNMQIVSSLLNMQAQTIDDPAARHPIDDAISRIYSIALIHEKLYRADNFTRIDMAAYVTELMDEIIQLFSKSPDDIQVITDLEQINLPIDQAVPCGIMINEILTNSIKHACRDTGPCRIDIRMSMSDGMMDLVIADSGPGMEHTIMESGGTKTMGMQIIRALAQQLNASIEVSTDEGTKYVIRFAL